MLSFRVDVVQQQTQTLPIEHRAHGCRGKGDIGGIDQALVRGRKEHWPSNPRRSVRETKSSLTFQGIFKELLGEVSGPLVLATSIYLFVNSGHEILAHLVQQRHKVLQHFGGDHLLVKNHAI